MSGRSAAVPDRGGAEYRLSRTARARLAAAAVPFALDGDEVRIDLVAVRESAAAMDVDAGDLLASGLLHEAQHRLLAALGGAGSAGAVARASRATEAALGRASVVEGLIAYCQRNPTAAIAAGRLTPGDELARPTGRADALEEAALGLIARENRALRPLQAVFVEPGAEPPSIERLVTAFAARLASDGDPAQRGADLMEILRTPARESPDSLAGQLRYLRDRWGPLLGDLLADLQLALDLLAEQASALRLRWSTGAGGGDSADVHLGLGQGEDIERFSADRDWMPRVVLMAKSTHVWLDQLARVYGREIRTLDAIPDEELATLAARGFTGLWLIGLWQRSHASAEIKHRHGDTEAVASAYSLDDYRIADELGGEPALADLRERAWRHGIRLASDMVPNHMGLDSRWVIEHPERFLSLTVSPIPSYHFDGPDLSRDDRVEIRLEDGYWDRSDAAVVFQRRDRASGDVRYVYHGNDGTSMPWNDTAQLDYLRAEVRESVIQAILDVARRFPIIRFDAAMTLAKRHVQRLWFPPPGGGGDAIPTRVGYGLSQADFDRAMPHEFWREVVDRVAAEVPDTLLLAEAFWMLEGYFVRTLGMHRVYNSAFMHMVRDERNAEYRAVIKETLAYDPEVLKRFVNFLNNPDERTAIDQFGDDDRYFCAATLMATLPGLPMFGHGQIEGFAEKYGMEFRRARWQEEPKGWLVERHDREVFPLLHRRWLFAEAEAFRLFDLDTDHGVADDVYAYVNRAGDERALVLVHNRYAEVEGRLRTSAPFSRPSGAGRRRHRQSLAESLSLPRRGRSWAVFRDLVSGQEGLRQCAGLHSDGFALRLRAFERRVLLDWRVEDDTDGALGALAARIGWDGMVPSVAEAVAAIRAEWQAAADAARSPATADADSGAPAAEAPDETVAPKPKARRAGRAPERSPTTGAPPDTTRGGPSRTRGAKPKETS